MHKIPNDHAREGLVWSPPQGTKKFPPEPLWVDRCQLLASARGPDKRSVPDRLKVAISAIKEQTFAVERTIPPDPPRVPALK
jgi:hypothetical protein